MADFIEIQKKHRMRFPFPFRVLFYPQSFKQFLLSLEHAAKEDENLMPYIIASVHAYATLGEICEVLRNIFGEYQEPIIY